eukprot:5925055-Alexandrium_andersonii.AAC.1
MARADERVNERLSREVQSCVEAEAAVAPRPEAVSSSGSRPAEAQGEQGGAFGPGGACVRGRAPGPRRV